MKGRGKGRGRVEGGEGGREEKGRGWRDGGREEKGRGWREGGR